MRIALIGPGILPIPPEGWGAVETVIWNLNSNLNDLGHQTLIINTRSRSDARQAITNFEPDIIWLHYDEYCTWLTDYGNTSRIWLTSHFAYLEQYHPWLIALAQTIPLIGHCPTKLWKLWCLGFKLLGHRRYAMASYFRILTAMLSTGRTTQLSMVCLSPTISETLAKTGVSRMILPNGAEQERIRYHRARGNGRALCLGKIEPRKRQKELTKISQLDFVGPVIDKRFPDHIPNYKGVWSREQVWEYLTDYSVLVLLSDGEAHALVICEALLAGLSLVVSTSASGNLKPDWPIVRRLTSQECNQPTIVAEAIRTMLHNADQQRQTAREIGLKYFSMQAQKLNLNKIIEA